MNKPKQNFTERKVDTTFILDSRDDPSFNKVPAK